MFNKDSSNYNGHVFAGLASLQLGHHDDAKRHYKTAIDVQPDNPLAWKVCFFVLTILCVQCRESTSIQEERVMHFHLMARSLCLIGGE